MVKVEGKLERLGSWGASEGHAASWESFPKGEPGPTVWMGGPPPFCVWPCRSSVNTSLSSCRSTCTALGRKKRMMRRICWRKNTPAYGRSVAFVLWTVLLTLSTMSTTTATIPSWISGGLPALQSQANFSPCIWTSIATTWPDIPNHFPCLWEHCESSFNNPEWLYWHVEGHRLCCEYKAVGKDNHVVLCGRKGCTYTFKDHCQLRNHPCSHTQEKVVACPTFRGMFAKNTKFLDHIYCQTSLDQQCFQCSHCSMRFVTGVVRPYA